MRRCAALRGLWLLPVLALAGCMTPQAARLQAVPPVAVELREVPFHAQAAHQCGPATLAMALGHLGQSVTPEALSRSLYLPARAGTLTEELVAQARQRGALPVPVAPSLQALADSLAEGVPVIILQNNGLSWYSVWHYALVVGVDPARGQMLLRSGPDPRLRLSWSVLDRTWARSGRWAIRLLPAAGPWPATVSADALVPPLLALARQRPDLAVAALRQGLSRWPQAVPLWLALAAAHEVGAGEAITTADLPAAERVLREGLQAVPQQPLLLNNLADVLLRQGRAREALPLARQAVAGADRAETRDTLATVEAAVRTDVQTPPGRRRR